MFIDVLVSYFPFIKSRILIQMKALTDIVSLK